MGNRMLNGMGLAEPALSLPTGRATARMELYCSLLGIVLMLRYTK